MTENDGNSRRPGRPRATTPLKVWGEYVEAVQIHCPGHRTAPRTLFEHLRRQAPSAVHETQTSFGRVLAGDMAAKPGFAVALAQGLGLEELGMTPADLDLPIAAFTERLVSNRPHSLARLLKTAVSGASIALRPSAMDLNAVRHFGAKAAAMTVLVAEVSHDLSITRPHEVQGVDGRLLLLGYGYEDHRWQLVSSVADRPVAPTANVQWGRHTGISITPSYQGGTFALYAIGSSTAFAPPLSALFDRHKGGDGFLNDREIATVEQCVGAAVKEGWVALLNYSIQR